MLAAEKFGWNRLSLAAKCLILLSIPLCLQLGFSIVLFQLQQEAEAEGQRAVESQALATHIGRLGTEVLQLFIASSSSDRVRSWPTSGYQGFLSPNYKAMLQKVVVEYHTLEKMTANKPKLNHVVKEAYKAMAEGVKVIEQANLEILAGHIDSVVGSSDEKDKYLRSLGTHMVSQELLLLADNEEEIVNESTRKQAAIRHNITKYSLIVNLASIFFSVLLARFLVQTLTSRLRILAENAVRFAAHQPLHARLSGYDEIAQLDQVFHDMASSMEESSQRKQEIYNMVTHDMRAPMTAVQSCLEMLCTGDTHEFTSRTRKLIGIAARNSSRTVGLVKDLLDSQKIDAGMLELSATSVHLEDVFETVSLDIAGWLEEFGMHVTFCDTDLIVTANEEMLGRILFNLISNAIKYSPPDSTVSVNATPDARMAEITVTDQGPGIPKHMLKSVFDRFRQVSSSDPMAGEGSGLGLSICKDLVELHGGHVWVTSERGQGSTFHFTMPLA